MKCSLLTLSTFIDDALADERAAEVDAHVVGCPRCSAGVTTLREERDRIAGLARVRVEWESAQALLEQVGIGATTATMPSPRRETPPAAVAPTRPWLSAGGGGAALPWTPQRPRVPTTPPPAITEEANVQTVDPDVQPDLPFDAPHPDPSATASREVEAVGHPQADPVAAGWGADLDDVPPGPLEDWEEAIPAYDDEVVATSVPSAPAPPADEPSPSSEPPPAPRWEDASPAAEWQAPAAEPAPALEPIVAPHGAVDYDVAVAESMAEPVVPMGPPQRLEPVSGPRALLQRARDLVTVRLALARSQPLDDVEAAMPPPIAREPLTPVRPASPIRGFEQPDTAAPVPVASAVAVEQMVTVAPPPGPSIDATPEKPPIELTGAAAPLTPAAARAQAIRALRTEAEVRRSAGAPVPDDWNAFGAAAYQQAREAEPPARPARVGRHVKQARKQPVPFRTRVAPILAAVNSALASAGVGFASAARAATGSARSAGKRASASVAGATASASRTATAGARTTVLSPRVVAAGGLALVVFLLALFIGRGGTASPHTAGTAARSATSATAAAHATAAPGTTQPAPATSAPSAATTAPLTGVQTFGAGAAGLSLDRVRYGVFNGSQRLVFDLSGPASGGPSTSIGFANPTTLVITFVGTAPPASWTAPPSGGVVTAITTTAAHGGTTTVTLTLSRASTPVAFYLSGPERFVIDLH